jgi:DNA-binding transcriptional regulator YiaG
MVAFVYNKGHFRRRMKPPPDPEPPPKRRGPGRPPKDQAGAPYAAQLRGVEIPPVVQELKAWRLRNGLTQPEAAEVLQGLFFHTTFATVRHWEAGVRAPNAYTAETLSRLLKAHPTVSAPGKGPRGRKGKKA